MELLMLFLGYKCDIVFWFISGIIFWEVLNGILSGELLWLVKFVGRCLCINKDDGSFLFKLLVWIVIFILLFVVIRVISFIVVLALLSWLV